MAEDTNPKQRDWKRRESFGSAVAQIAVVGLLLAGAVYFIYARGTKKKETTERLKEARALALRDNPKDLRAALAKLDELFEIDSSNADALAVAAGLHTELWLIHKVPGEDAKAKELLVKAEAKESNAEERYASRALHLLAEGKAAEADAYIDELRKKGASSARLWHAVGRAQQELGNLSMAKQALAQAMDKAWKDPRFGTAFGEALIDEGNYLQALDALTKTLNANPDHFRARLAASLAYIHRKDRVKDASDTVEDILSRDAELTPGIKARALAVKAELANFEGRHDDAVKTAQMALAIHPDEHVALLAKARALGLTKDAAASDAFKAAVAKRPTAPAIYFDGATLLQGAGNHEEAMALLSSYETTFSKVKATLPDGKEVPALSRDDRYWLTRGDILREAGKLDDAMSAYDKAVAAENVNLVKAHYARGALLLQKGEVDKAMEALAQITPPDGSGSLAEAYVAMGDTQFAKKMFAEGCQNFAFALAKLKTQQAPREKLNGLLEDVNRRLVAANQRPMAKLWMEEAKPIIQ
ncbi:MAG: tetratricopeptide repeat protein [Myxococcota bacterium]